MKLWEYQPISFAMRPDVSLALSFEETWEFAIWIHFDLSGSTYRQTPGVAASGWRCASRVERIWEVTVIDSAALSWVWFSLDCRRLSRTFCCCGEATERLSVALSKDPHLWQAWLWPFDTYKMELIESLHQPKWTLCSLSLSLSHDILGHSVESFELNLWKSFLVQDTYWNSNCVPRAA